MPDLHAMVPGSMPMGWLKKISALEEQNRQRQREIQALVERLKKLEEFITGHFVAKANQYAAAGVAAVVAEPDPALLPPIKRGPGRPRKNPQ